MPVGGPKTPLRPVGKRPQIARGPRRENGAITLGGYKMPKARSRPRPSFLFAWLSMLALILVPVSSAVAQGQAAAYGFAAHRPVVAAACLHCPYGTVAGILKTAMKATGYDLQICNNCAGATGATIVADRCRPPPAAPNADPKLTPPSPDAPVDIGINNPMWLNWTYEGSHGFNNGVAKHNLRTIATVQYPRYLIVAVKAGSGITDLGQLRGKPARIILGYMIEPDVLTYYGLSKESVEAAGGKILSGTNPADRQDFDAIIYGGNLNNTPEFNLW